MKHERIRTFNTRDVYPHQTLDNDMCMVIRAGNRIFLRGQTGLDLQQNMVDPNDAAAQADQAMQNVKILLDILNARSAGISRSNSHLTHTSFIVTLWH